MEVDKCLFWVTYSGALALCLGHHHPGYYEERGLVPSEGIWYIYFLQSVGSFNKLRLYLYVGYTVG